LTFGPLDTTAGADHRVRGDTRVREERVAQLHADELDQSAALTRIPVRVELDLVLGARPLGADEKGETAGWRESEGDGLDRTGVVELHACGPVEAPPELGPPRCVLR
jgi:hypothetical protein